MTHQGSCPKPRFCSLHPKSEAIHSLFEHPTATAWLWNLLAALLGALRQAPQSLTLVIHDPPTHAMIFEVLHRDPDRIYLDPKWKAGLRITTVKPPRVILESRCSFPPKVRDYLPHLRTFHRLIAVESVCHGFVTDHRRDASASFLKSSQCSLKLPPTIAASSPTSFASEKDTR